MAAVMPFFRYAVKDFVDKSYTMRSLKSLYASIIPPILTEDLEPDETTLPSPIRRQAGGPRVVRIRNRSEYRLEDSPFSCGNCG
jgi:hypothetical protein